MVTVIDALESVDGWTATGDAEVVGVNEHPEAVADWRSASGLFRFTGEGGKVSRSLSVDVSDRDEIVLSLWSRARGRGRYVDPEDYSYKLTVNGDFEWLLPVFRSFTSVTLELPDGLEAVESLEIESLRGGEDWLAVSCVYAVRDEFPLDVMKGVVEGIEFARGDLAPEGLEVGSLSGSAGDTEAEFGFDVPLVGRYSVVRIWDGDNEEFHQVESEDGVKMRFTDLYDGRALLHDYDGASVSLWFPVEFGRYEEEAVVPGVVVYAMAPEPAASTSELARVRDNRRADGMWSERREPMALEYPVLVTCEAWHGSVQALQNRIVRWWLGSNRCWINGRLHDIEFDEIPVSTEPQGLETAMQVQYTVRVQVREERARRADRPGAGEADFEASVREVRQ